MVNSDWRERAKAALEKMLAPDSSVKSKKAKARARDRARVREAVEAVEAAAAAASTEKNGVAIGVIDAKEKDA